MAAYQRVYPGEAAGHGVFRQGEPQPRALCLRHPVADSLSEVAATALNPRHTLPVLLAYPQLSLEIVSRWIDQVEGGLASVVAVFAALGRACGAVSASASLVEYFLASYRKALWAQRSIDVLLAFYRLLVHDRHRFRRFVSPDALHATLDGPPDAAAKLLCVELLCMYLDASDRLRRQMMARHCPAAVRAAIDGERELDLTLLAVLEAKRVANFHTLALCLAAVPPSPAAVVVEPTHLSRHVVLVCGVLVPRVAASQPPAAAAAPVAAMVPTAAAVAVLQQLARNIQQNTPTMLYGPAGAGKTFLIQESARRLGYDRQLVRIHLGEQTDAKLLLGTYALGEKPGTFEWRAGVLTTAVQQGRWVVIEDIDQAPTEVLLVLLTLLEKRQLTIPLRGEVVTAANGFQLLATVRLAARQSLPDLIGLRLWRVVSVAAPLEADLRNILLRRFPALQVLLPRLLACFHEIVRIYATLQFVALNRGLHPRVISFRDLVKLCRRCDAMLAREGVAASGLLPQHVFDQIFAETVDCFGSAVTEPAALAPLVSVIGDKLEVAQSRINLYLTKHVPVFANSERVLRVGRAVLPKGPGVSSTLLLFARTNHLLRLMEQIGVAVQMAEPVLLVGETGTGKTTVVQQVARMVHKHLTVINVSQQTELGDLLGGYKPVNTKTIAVPLQQSFDALFTASFSQRKNEKFVAILTKCFTKGQWRNVVKLWLEAVRMAKEVLADAGPKRRRLDDAAALLAQWSEFETRVRAFEAQARLLDQAAFVFSFVEGALVKAVRNGDWLLLDEINLASADTLESIADLLADERLLLLTERGDVEPVAAHPDFRIFGCMNPSTDVGKRDLPLSIRLRFTELYVHSPDGDIEDLLAIIDQYIGRYAVADEWVGNDVAELYLAAKRMSEENKIVDGANQRPHFSIRTLTRTLVYVCDIVSVYGLRRALYEAFCMLYLTLLDATLEALLHAEIVRCVLGRLKNAKLVMRQTPPAPAGPYVQFKHYWMKRGPREPVPQPHYIITPFVEKNMLNLVRATAGRRFPVLVQGPTLAGKTSMIQYLASITGHKFVRINNHEHTDLQEYLGTYVLDASGKLVFREGVLVEALRQGHWIVLDELNLAPTDVLEALNRLLDDNREILIPETQEVVRPHPDFMLFATQNPPGLYGGRKMLLRAFRNRFLELHFDDIPQDELEVILRERCQIAPSYGKKIVEVYRQLLVQRQSTRLFEQKNSFATLRDLFRWAMRDAVGYEELAANGFMLLGERVRKREEKEVVRRTIERVMRVTLDMEAHYAKLEREAQLAPMMQDGAIVWTAAMRRLAVLVHTSMKYNEPLLLVGETGCGKTTVCQVVAQFLGRALVTVNAHQNTETGDILGAQRPVRHRYETQSALYNRLVEVLGEAPPDATLDTLLRMYDEAPHPEALAAAEIAELRRNAAVLFDWVDGPLVQAMKHGDFFLLDEISLADDLVLERLNSVLEPERSLLLAEKGNDDSFVTAAPSFEFLATMNPGGDYGKKELSPALRNRFTEIWVPSMESFDDVRQVVAAKLAHPEVCEPLVQFLEWYGERYGSGNASSGVISLRDILAWVQFINATAATLGAFGALLHGAALVFIDALGTNNTAYLAASEARLAEEKEHAVAMLSRFAHRDLLPYYRGEVAVQNLGDRLVCGGFGIAKVQRQQQALAFNLEAPTTAANAMRVLRAMQVNKPILLEGLPGVGKTSLVLALAQATGNPLVRINLSEQTDLVDLFGSDAPAEGGKAGEFVWRDAPFLRAMQRGEWVLLDEMNLASQLVLEGLNACLDHRGSAYIPELDKTFSKHAGFVVFAAQNPQYQGGGRKGLPKSFVNRFSVVYVDVLKEVDLNMILQHLFPAVDRDTNAKMIHYILRLEHEVSVAKSFGHTGGPWEFNLRDTLRWLDLYNTKSLGSVVTPAAFLDMIVCQRFRTAEDKRRAQQLYCEVFGERLEQSDNYYAVAEDAVQACGATVARREPVQHTIAGGRTALQANFRLWETAIRCVNLRLPLILTGPTNAGKTELIRTLAETVGARLDEFAMNSDVDSMDILGGYEQVDVEKGVIALAARVRAALVGQIVVSLADADAADDATRIALQAVRYIDTRDEGAAAFISKLTGLVEPLLNPELAALHAALRQLLAKIDEQQHESVRFEWFDGLLVQAVEQGHWLVLDNANLCSPSVLDRLNSLLEVNGTLVINECSGVDGQPRTVKPHPNFRLFLTVDPKYGELSRAMRNRGIEVFVEPLDSRLTQFDRAAATSRYVSGQLSRERSFALMDDTLAVSTLEAPQLVNTLVGTVRFDSVGLVKSWRDIVGSREFPSSTTAFANDVDARFDDKTFQGAIDKLHQLYTCGDDVARHQTLQVLWNTYLTSIASAEPAFYFEVFGSAVQIARLVALLEERAMAKRLGELLYLERSAALNLGRNLKKAPRLNVHRFITGVRDYIVSTVRDTPVVGAQPSLQRLLELEVTLKCLVESEQQDETRLRVFQELVRKWCDDEGAATLSPVVEALGSELQLTTGFSMAKIWEALRCSYPASAEAWRQTEELSRLAQLFDTVACQQFEDADDAVFALRDMFVSVFREVIQAPLAPEAFDEFRANMESGIASLELVSSNFIIKRHNLLEDQFGLLATLAESIQLVGGATEVLRKLLKWGGRSTLSQCSAGLPYPAVLDHMWPVRNGQCHSLVHGIFSNEMLTTTLVKCQTLGSGPGKYLQQNLDDFKNFASELVALSPSALASRAQVYGELLKKWVMEIISIHVSIAIDTADVASIRLAVQDHKFLAILDQFLLPSLHLVNNSCDAAGLGKAWVLFACGAIQLYVPSTAYDPAITDHVAYERFQSLQREADALVESWRSARVALSGDEAVKPELMVRESVLASLAAAATQKPRVYRPRVSSIDNLFEEWLAFLTSTVDTGAVKRLMEAAEASTDAATLVAMFQNNSSHFLVRLQQSYFVYSDLIDILRGFVFGMKLGFDLINLTPQVKDVPRVWSVDVAAVASLAMLKRNFALVKAFTKSFDVTSTLPEQVMMYLIRLGFAHQRATDKDPELDSILQQAFQALYYRWSLRRMKKEEDDAAQGNLYKYADPTTDLEGDFKQLFPDFEEVMESEAAADAAAASKASPEAAFEELYAKIGQLYVSSFTALPSAFALTDILDEGSKLHALMSSHMEGFSEASTAGTLSTVVARITQQLDAFKDEKSVLDFYRDTSPAQTKRSITIIKALQISALKLLEQWPEHATLQNISRICEEYLSFPMDTPLARLLQKIEQIYTYIAEWEKYASSQVTLKAHFDALTTLIVSWRKMELSTWQSLFKHEDAVVEQSLGKWWFHLFETIIVPQLGQDADEADYVKIIGALNVFMGQASYGDFGHRLRLLTAFANHLGDIGDVRSSESLRNFITFYQQFLPVIEQNMVALRKKLEKDINEVILLASWKDVNIDALKQSARRSHNNLYKIVRKYRALLATPVSPIIELGLSADTRTSVNVSDVPMCAEDINVDVSAVVQVPTWSDRPQRLQNIALVTKNVEVYTAHVAQDVLPAISDYARDVTHDMNRLRDETPKELKKDNKKLIATLLTQKRKLLSDTLRELRRIGLKLSLRADIHKLQETVSQMLCNTSSFERFPVLRGIDAYYFRILDLMPRLRAAVVGGLAEGVPQSDADKALAALENLVFSLVTIRQPLALLAASIDNIGTIVATMEKMSESVLSHNKLWTSGSWQLSVGINVTTVKECAHWLAMMLDFAINNLEAIGHLQGNAVDKGVFYAAKMRLGELAAKEVVSGTASEVEFVEEFADFFNTWLVPELTAWKTRPEHHSLAFVADTIFEWIHAQLYNFRLEVDATTTEGLVDSLEFALRDLATSIILCVQKVVAECDLGPIKEEDDGWLMLSQQRMTKYLKSLHHLQIKNKLDRVMKLARGMEHDRQLSTLSAALVAFTVPLVKRYLNLAVVIINKSRANYVNLSKGTFILSSSLHLLATKGFCSPEPPSEQKEDNNLHEGTGLGDGEGATNNSKDVEEDEDLTENAQEPNEENKEKDEEDDNDDAVDIEGDMAGELEDASDQDKDDEGDDEGEESMDEEVDDLDDLDPNAIDDKMWDEEAQENSKEKDSEKMPEGANDDNMEANEDDAEGKQQEKGEGKEEEDEDDGTDGDDEKDVGEQEDEVKNEENEALEENVPETEALDLPDDMNLDSGDEHSGAEDNDDEFEDKMDVDEEKNDDGEDEQKNEEGEKENGEMEDGEDEDEGEAEEGELDDAEPDEPNKEDGADVDEEGGVDSDEEAAAEKPEEPQEEGGNDNEAAQDKVDGVDGANEDAANDDMDAETAVKQESGDRGEGDDNQVAEENEDVGATGGASSDAQQDMEKEDTREEARDTARESLKQLGDSMKEFHRRRQEIKEAASRAEEPQQDTKSANERPDEFEHLEGETADFDTQALGAADKDQVQTINEDNAIDDVKEEVREEQMEAPATEAAEKDEQDAPDGQDGEQDEQPTDDFEGQARGGSARDAKEEKEVDLKDFVDDEMKIDDMADAPEQEPVFGEESSLPPLELDEARELWKHSEMATQELASGLCEQLRLILEPTLATKLRGDYKTGKRLNMKRIIPYIASDFRKDKIWLRRTKPLKRQYQIMIAIDDSKSMSESKSTELAFHSIALVLKALTQLEAGGLCIVRFGEDVKVVHPFDKPFNNQETGAQIFQWFDFKQTRTDIKRLCQQSLRIFEDARATLLLDLWQLQIILSDGVCEDHDTVQRLVRRAREQKVMLVFVVIDGINSNESILDMSQVAYELDAVTGTSSLKVTKYLDTFPFEFYVIVRNINELPQMLSLILRQYFSEMAAA